MFHGFGGRLPVKDVQLSAINNVMKRTFEELGVKTRDVNGRNMYGYGPTQATIRWGSRYGTYKAFLKRVLHNENLYILTQALAQRVRATNIFTRAHALRVRTTAVQSVHDMHG